MRLRDHLRSHRGRVRSVHEVPSRAPVLPDAGTANRRVRLVLSVHRRELRDTVRAIAVLTAESAAAILLVAAAVGCGESHGPPDAFNSRRDARVIGDTSGPIAFPEIAGDRRLADLNESDWVALCEWRSTLRPIDADYYYCTADGENCLTDPAGVCPLPHFWTRDSCADTEMGEASYWLGRPPCTSTVEEWSLCIRAQAVLPVGRPLPGLLRDRLLRALTDELKSWASRSGRGSTCLGRSRSRGACRRGRLRR